jgi:hypothetical protein
MRDTANAVLDWLVGDCFGLTGQNWMMVVGGGLLLYIAGLVIARRRPTGTR